MQKTSKKEPVPSQESPKDSLVQITTEVPKPVYDRLAKEAADNESSVAGRARLALKRDHQQLTGSALS